MDRDTAIIIAVTTIVLTLIGGIYLGRPSTPAERQAQETLSTEDVRYKYQQAELKRGKKKEPPPADYATAPESPRTKPRRTTKARATAAQTTKAPKNRRSTKRVNALFRLPLRSKKR